MNHIDLPAGTVIRLTATARPRLALHHWDMRIFAADDMRPDARARLSYGSQIGGRDCDQRINVPIQDQDCRIEVTCGRLQASGLQDQQGSEEDDTPDHLVIGFADAPASESSADDVVLSFDFSRPPRSEMPE